MACVTLKRPLDFDPLHSPNHRPSPSKRPRRCMPIQKNNRNNKIIEQSRDAETSTPSVFRETPLTPGEIANSLRDELKRLKRRRQLAPYSPGSPGRSSNPGSPEPMNDDISRTATTAAVPTASTSSTSSSSSSAVIREKPLFTLKQMTLICERMCKERTDQVREEYDKILQQKLSEQYDAFVKFVDHQIQQRFNDSQLPSYLS